MVKRHKRSFALTAIFLLLAQVLMMTFCNITAIAVTKDESSETLFDNEYGKATISYENLDGGRLKWTVDLQKVAHKAASRFMVELTADEQVITPENIQTTE